MKLRDGQEHDLNSRARVAQQKKIAQQQKTMRLLDKEYKKKINEAKNASELRLQETRNEGRAQLLNQVETQEKKLAEIKAENKQYKQSLENEMKSLLVTHEDQKSERESSFLKRAHQVQDQNEERIYDLEQRARLSFDKAKSRLETKSIENNSRANDTLQTIALTNEQKIVNNQNSYQGQLKTQAEDFSQKIDQKKRENETANKQLDRLHNHEFKLKEETFLAEKKRLNERHQYLLGQEKTRFQKLYQETVQNHNQVINEVRSRQDKQLNQIVRGYSDQRANIAERAQDEFYKVKTINPQVKDTVGHYEISLEVPPHERDSVTLTGHDRNLRISLAREYHDELRDEVTGKVDKTRRTENLFKQFHLPEIIDPKKISKKYQDGVLTYQIAKK